MTDLEGAVERVKARIHSHTDASQPSIVVGDIRTILDALASITRERDAMREAGKPFFDLAKTVTTPTPGSPPWWQESQDWTVVFSFAGCSVTLGDLRRAAARAQGPGEAVAWRYRFLDRMDGTLSEWDATTNRDAAFALAGPNGEVEPLYAATPTREA